MNDDSLDVEPVGGKNEPTMNFATDETVTTDKHGHAKGKVLKIGKDHKPQSPSQPMKMSDEELQRTEAQSRATVRMYATYENPHEMDPEKRTITFAGTGSMVCKQLGPGNQGIAKISTNDHTIAKHMPPVAGISADKRLNYILKEISTDPSRKSSIDNREEMWSCKKLTERVENMKLLNETVPSMASDFAFCSCTAPNKDLEKRGILIPSMLPQSSTHQHNHAQGVGYPGRTPLLKHESLFEGKIHSKSLIQGKLKSNQGSSTVEHSVPTKKGMSGTHLGILGTPVDSFQAIHSRSIDEITGENGGISTSNVAFAEQYRKHIYKDLPPDKKSQATQYLFGFGDEQCSLANSWFDRFKFWTP